MYLECVKTVEPEDRVWPVLHKGYEWIIALSQQIDPVRSNSGGFQGKSAFPAGCQAQMRPLQHLWTCTSSNYSTILPHNKAWETPLQPLTFAS